MMSRASPVLIGLMTFASCAFQLPTEDPALKQNPQPSEPAASIGKPMPYELAVDWSNEPDPTLSPEVKAIRTLLSEKTAVFESDEPVSLPAVVPGTVFVVATLPANVLPGQVQFSRAWLNLPENRFQIVSEPLQTESDKDGRRKVVLKVSGLNALFPKQSSIAGILELDLFDEANRMAKLKIKLRTPPSHVHAELLGVRDWKREIDPERTLLMSLDVLGRKLSMVRVLRLRNDEKTRIELQFYRRPEASLTQLTSNFAHRDLGCGFAIDETTRQESFAEEILILPVSERLIPEATASLLDPKLKDRISLSLASGEEQYIAIFSVGEAGRSWLERGALLPDLRQVTVPNDCYQVCVKLKCECNRPECGLDFMEGQISPQVCHCAEEEQRRHPAEVTVGVNRGPMVLSVRGDYPLWVARFTDLVLRKDSEIRMVRMLPDTSEVPSP